MRNNGALNANYLHDLCINWRLCALSGSFKAVLRTKLTNKGYYFSMSYFLPCC